MNKVAKITIIAVLAVIVTMVIILKQNNKANCETVVIEVPINIVEGSKSEGFETVKVVASEVMPRLVDLGAGKCIPCKMMAPILEELKKEYAGSLRVDVFDVENNPGIAEEYRVWIIPTQIFFDASGIECFRHEGFMSKEDILAKWKELGVELTKTR